MSWIRYVGVGYTRCGASLSTLSFWGVDAALPTQVEPTFEVGSTLPDAF